MSPLSRRKLIATATAVPLIAPPARARPSSAQTRNADPVITKVSSWIAAKQCQDQLVRQWQELENRLCDRIRPLGMNLTQASRSALPEARQMRSLMRQIRLADRRLDRAAAHLVQLRARSPAGALAKIEMGLRIQEPLDCEDYAWALLLGGFEELSSLLRDEHPPQGV